MDLNVPQKQIEIVGVITRGALVKHGFFFCLAANRLIACLVLRAHVLPLGNVHGIQFYVSVLDFQPSLLHPLKLG